MSPSRSLISATVNFDQLDTVQRGCLRVPFSHDRSAYGYIPIPLWVAQRGSGPTVLLTGGVHGDEYEGPIALMRLIQDFPFEKLCGRIIAIPALNYPAFAAATRTSPIDRLNLNRCFPGSRNGSPTDMIAHYVETELLPRVDYCFDFHAGGSSLNYLPTLIVADRPKTDARRAVIDKLVEAFDPPRVLYMDMLGEDRVISSAAERHNVCFLTGEFGGGASVNIEGLEIVRGGIARMLGALGMLSDVEGYARPDNRRPIERLSVKGAEHYIFAPRAGIFEPRFKLGDDVREGQVAGYIHDPSAPWHPPEEVRFAGNGNVLCIRTFAQVSGGDCLGHLASEDA